MNVLDDGPGPRSAAGNMPSTPQPSRTSSRRPTQSLPPPPSPPRATTALFAPQPSLHHSPMYQQPPQPDPSPLPPPPSPVQPKPSMHHSPPQLQQQAAGGHSRGWAGWAAAAGLCNAAGLAEILLNSDFVGFVCVAISQLCHVAVCPPTTKMQAKARCGRMWVENATVTTRVV